MPSEAELTELFSTSRSTIREALAELERDRIIIRRQGSGTYINPALRKVGTTVNELVDPFRMIELQGYQASIAFSECRSAPTGEAIGDRLETPAEMQSVHARVLYLADKEPAIWLNAVIPVDPLRSAESTIPQFTSLFQFSVEVSGRVATHSIASIKATPADRIAAAQLNTQPGQSLVTLEEMYFTDYGRPVFLSFMSFLPDVIQLQLVRNSYRTSERISIW